MANRSYNRQFHFEHPMVPRQLKRVQYLETGSMSRKFAVSWLHIERTRDCQSTPPNHTTSTLRNSPKKSLNMSPIHLPMARSVILVSSFWLGDARCTIYRKNEIMHVGGGRWMWGPNWSRVARSIMDASGLNVGTKNRMNVEAKLKGSDPPTYPPTCT